jgi:hypothetical protein
MNIDEELRRLFGDDRLDVAVRPDADRVIVAGARRIRRCRFVAATAGAVAVAVLLGSGIALAGDGKQASLPPAESMDTTPPTTTAPPDTTTTTTPPSATKPPEAPPPSPGTRNPTPTEEETTPAPTTPPVPPPVDVVDAVFGPSGYGPLTLGMPLDAAVATGALGEALWDNGICARYPVNGGGHVLISHKFGTTRIAAGPSARTPEGIGFGSTVAEIRTAYPGAVDYRYGLTSGPYGFYVEGPEQEVYPDELAVIDMRLEQMSTDCANAS